jgi:protein phosphatase
MGGHEAGDVASRVVVEELAAIAAPHSRRFVGKLRTHMISATAVSKTRQRAAVRHRYHGAVLLIFDGHYASVWSGDSRIYLIRQHRIEQISVDHTENAGTHFEGKLTAQEARPGPSKCHKLPS